MCEMLPYVSGSRFPMVMPVVNRSMAAPWTIWGDQQDAISQRDTGWIQLFVENAQEAFDTCIQAYRLAEDPEVMTPVMVNLDGLCFPIRKNWWIYRLRKKSRPFAAVPSAVCG